MGIFISLYICINLNTVLFLNEMKINLVLKVKEGEKREKVNPKKTSVQEKLHLVAEWPQGCLKLLLFLECGVGSEA